MTEPRRERCWKCDAVHDVDAKGRLVVHERANGWRYSDGGMQVASTIRCDGSFRPSKEEMSRRAADRELAIHREIEDVRAEASVAIDAMIEGRGEYADKVARWGWLALWSYRKRWKVSAVYPWRYETRCAASSRRASTLGDILCRFCGVVIAAKCKNPADVVAESEHAKRHLATCALHVLCGLREPASPTHRVGLVEMIETGVAQQGDSGPLFGGAR